jgi:hypothetical protein
MLLSRLIPSMLPPAHQKFFGIPPHLLAKIFVTSDVISFLTQASGSGIASSGNWEGSTLDVGENVLIGGLALQVATFAFFMLVVASLHRRKMVMGVEKGGSGQGSSFRENEGWRPVLTGVYAAGVLVFVSCPISIFLVILRCSCLFRGAPGF